MPKSSISKIKWRTQHTLILKRYYTLKSLHPFAKQYHFTVTPKGNKVPKNSLRARFNNTLVQNPYIYSVIYNYEVSEQGVHHIHGIMLAAEDKHIRPTFDANELSFIHSQGGLKGWIKYMTKDKGKTHSKNRNEPLIENYK